MEYIYVAFIWILMQAVTRFPESIYSNITGLKKIEKVDIIYITQEGIMSEPVSFYN